MRVIRCGTLRTEWMILKKSMSPFIGDNGLCRSRFFLTST